MQQGNIEIEKHKKKKSKKQVRERVEKASQDVKEMEKQATVVNQEQTPENMKETDPVILEFDSYVTPPRLVRAIKKTIVFKEIKWTKKPYIDYFRCPWNR